MTSPMAPRSLRTPVVSSFMGLLRKFAPLSLLMGAGMVYAAPPATTTTTLAISATSVPYQTPIVLTATVTSGGSPVSSGLVMFCAVTSTNCETNSSLATVQLTSSNATAVVKIGSGPLGLHSYKAVYRANNLYASSTSSPVSYTVQGTYSSTTAIASSGAVGNYTLASTVSGIGSLTVGPTGTVSFLDASAGNNVLGTQALGAAVLTDKFATASGSPFDISGNGNTTIRSVAIESAYLNGDNNLDLVTGDANQIITVLLGNGDGTFQPKVNYPGCTVGKALKMLLADFNRDGNTDIALGCSDGTNGGLVVLLGDGHGGFGAPTMYSSGDVEGLAMGDFNNDGILDVVVTDQTQHNVVLFTGNGDGTFQAGTTITTTSSAAHDVVVGDFNKDGNDDLAFAIATSATNSVLSDLYVAIGKGDGTFKTATKVASQVGEFLAAGDLNADGIPDVVSTTITGGTPEHIGPWLWVFIGNGTGSFKTPVSYTSDIPSDPHIADVNGDGKPDIIAGGSFGALVYLGNGDGTFQAYTEPLIGNFALTYAVTAGDFNNDGNADLAGTDAGSPRAAVSLSQVAQEADAAALTGVAVFPLGSGLHNVDASYPGDSVYTGSVSSTVALMAAPTPTTLTLGVSPTSGTLSGQAVTLTATLDPYTVGPPTTTTNGESVNFYSGSALIGSAQLNNGVATLVTTTLPVGSDALKAIYPGDTNYNSSTSSVVSVTVTGILLTSSPNPSTYGQSVTLTSTTGAGQTGTVTFMDGTTTLGTSTISGTSAKFSTSTLTGGSHNLTAVYSGDSTHGAATSPVVTQVVNKANLGDFDVTATPPTTNYGQTVTITATTHSTDATGTVTFTSGGVTLGTGTLSGGTASITTNVLPVGTDTITGSYSGDNDYNSASGTATETVKKGSPTSTLTSSANPAAPGVSVTFTDTLSSAVTGTVTFSNGSTVLGTASVNGTVATFSTSSLPLGSNTITAAYGGDSGNNASSATMTETIAKNSPTVTVTANPTSSTYGQTVTITATVPSGVTGSITFTSGGQTLGSGTITGTTVTITTSSLPVGSDTITASYGGDTANNTATGTATETVSKASPSITLTSSVNPSSLNQSVTFTATLPATATGTVTFTNGATNLGTATISNGVATVSSSSLPVGSDTITASYGGDSNNGTASTTLTQTVNKATPTVTVTANPSSSSFGQTVTITATVPSGVTGTITFTSGGQTLGSGGISGGTVSITTSSLPIGSDTITASYGGDGNNNTATGTTVETVNKMNSTVTVTTSGPSVYGTSVTISATVTSGATGTVTFTSGGQTLGTGTLNGSSATSITTTVLPVGTDTITATYNGDTKYNTSTGTTTQTVTKATPSMTLNSSANPAQSNQPITFTATLPTNVTGTVVFTSNGNPLGSGTITNGVATVTTSSLPIGSDPILATYAGDSNNNGATANMTETISKGTPTVTVTANPSTSTYGQTVTITSSVIAGATGTITVTSGGQTLGSGAVSAAGTFVITTSSLPVGTDTITASYSGDSNDNAGTGSTTEVVSKNTPTVTVTTSGPTTVGQPVTITTTLPPGTTGTVTITSGGNTIGTGTVGPTGTVTITTSTLPVGSDPITATYSGDGNNNPSTGTVTQVVNPLTTTVTLTSSNNPATVGQSITFTATVPTTATGTITFSDGGSSLGSGTVVSGVASITVPSMSAGTHTITASYSGDTNDSAATSAPLTETVNKVTPVLPPPVVSAPTIPAGGSETITETVPPGVTGPVTFSDGGTTIGTAPVVGGVATITVTNLPVGSDPITASTPGDANNNPATSPATIVTVTKGTPTVGLASSVNPSAANQPVTFTATVPTGATGTVTFTDGGTTIGTATVANGVATVTDSSLTVGSHTITASYGGDTNYNPATSSPLTQVVNKATPTLPPPVVSAPTEPYGGTETITETVPPGVSGPVTFSNGGTVIGTAPVVGGVATITVNNLPVGSDPITASTPGDANNNPATSPATTVTVTPAAPTVTLTSSVNPSSANQPVTFTASIPTAATGTITFKDGSTVLGTSPVKAGVATLTTSTLSVGTHTITAVYGGDTSYGAATSAPLSQVVGTIPTMITLTQSTNTELLGTSVTFTATVSSTVPTPTGTVSIMDGTTVLGTAPLSTNGAVVSLDLSGNAAYATSSLTTGTHTITAVYSGSTNFATSTSAPVTNIVQDFTNTNSGKTTQNVSPGQSTSYTFTITPVGSTTFMSDVNLTVDGLPAGSTATFSPVKVAAGGGTATVTMNVTTTGSLSSRNGGPNGGDPLSHDAPIALGMLGLAGLGAARKYRRKMPRMLMMLLLLAGSLLPVAALTGCAGGYFGFKPTTYSVTVTGTEGTIQHSATATLVVE